MAVNKKPTVEELVAKYSATPTSAKVLYNKLVKYNLTEKRALLDLTVDEIVYNFGFGRASVITLMNVICDLAGKK